LAVNTILITEYDDEEFKHIEGTETLAKEVADLFRRFKLTSDRPAVVAQGRLDREQLKSAMKNWAPSPLGSVVYWLGHGDGPSPGRLVHSNADSALRSDGVQPAELADHLNVLGQDTPFIILILEACETDEYVNNLRQRLREYTHKCPVLILYSSDTVTVPRSVLKVLSSHLTFQLHAPEIFLADIRSQFDKQSGPTGIAADGLNVGDAALLNPDPLPPGQTVDVMLRLLDLVDELTEDEREHFFRRAQSTTFRPRVDSEPEITGELTWNFEGRDLERQRVRDWIDDDRPLCVVQGAGGQGKSAFLGDIVTRCRPELAQALARADLMTFDPTWQDVGHQKRTIAINATGLTTTRLVQRALEELGADSFAAPYSDSTDPRDPNEIDNGDGVEYFLTLIADAVNNALNEQVLFIIDGIDEMQDPHEGARVVSALATTTNTKLLVATRDQPNDGQTFLQYASSSLTQVLRDGHPAGAVLEVPLETDPDAINRYLRRRLTNEVPEAPAQDDIGRQVSDFLHAQLILEEVVAEPAWLTEGSLADVADFDIADLYKSMFGRLEDTNPAFKTIFQACALAQGRGIPALDDVWLTTARALAGHTGTQSEQSEHGKDGLTAETLSDFIHVAKAHIRVDVEHGQTVFRPAHSLLREALLSTIIDVQGVHSILAKVCAEQAANPNGNTRTGVTNAYYRHAATMHARQSAARQGWWEIDLLGADAWRHLDQRRVVEDAMRDLFGRTTIPSGVEKAILSNHHTQLGPAAAVEGWTQALRDGHRRAKRDRDPETTYSARVRWARSIARQPVFLSLPGHRGRITAIRQTELGPDEPGLLVGTSRGDVWLWNLQTAGLVGTLDGLNSPVFALGSSVTEAGLIVAAADSSGRLAAWAARDQRQLWNIDAIKDAADLTRTRSQSGANPVTALELHRLHDGALCVITVHEDRVQIFDIDTNRRIMPASMLPSAAPRFAPQIAIGAADHQGRHTVAVPARDVPGYYPLTIDDLGDAWGITRHDLIALAAESVAIKAHPTVPNTFRHLTSNGQVGRSNPDSVRPQAKSARRNAVDDTEDTTASITPISTGDVAVDATVLTHANADPHTGLVQIHINKNGQHREVHASHGSKPSALTIVERRDQKPLVATGASDRTVRVWDPYSAPASHTGDTEKVGAGGNVRLVSHVHSLPAGNRETLALTADSQGRIQFIQGSTGRLIETPDFKRPVTNLASSTNNPGQSVIAAALRDGAVHLWRQQGTDKPKRHSQLLNLGGGARVDVNAAGTHLVVINNDGHVGLWEQGTKNALIQEAFLEDRTETPLSVKLHTPFDDLAVIAIITKTLVQAIEVETTRHRRRVTKFAEPHGIADLTAHSLYTNHHHIGLLAGTGDGQTHTVPDIWVPKNHIAVSNRKTIPVMNLQQPVTAIHALMTPEQPITITACGAHGRVRTAQSHTAHGVHTIELGQPITAVHTHRRGQLLAALLGGVALLDLHTR
jgi:WD40 repeat protein